MSELQSLLDRLSAATTAAFTQAVKQLNDDAPGTVYAVMALLDSGIVRVSLVANTTEKLDLRPTDSSIPPDSPYWEVHPAQFDTFIWEPFEGVTELLAQFHDAFWNDEYDIDEDVEPGDFLAPIIQKAYAEAAVQTTVSTTYDGPLLLGLGYTDASDSQIAHVLTASEALNTPEWHQKVVAGWGR